MALKIEWSDEAEQTYLNILNYLENNWSRKEVLKFVKRTETLLGTILTQPYLFKASKNQHIRKAVIGKQNSLLYRVTDQHILFVNLLG
jgi:hypothetical protein